MKDKILYTIAALFMALAVNGASRVSSINQWTHYIAYSDAQKVIPTGNDVFVLSSGRLYSFSLTDGYPSYTEYTSISGLSTNNDIVDVQYNSTTKKLVIAYDDCNVDLLSVKNHDIENIAAIYSLNTTNTKSISNVLCYGKNAYVTLPWGIVIINTDKAEVSDTYRLDTDLSTGEKLTSCWIQNDSMYVSASEKRSYWSNATMIRGSLKNNLLDKNNWTAVDAGCEKEILSRIKEYKYSSCVLDEKSKKRVIEDTHNKCYWCAEDGNVVMCDKDGNVIKTLNIDTQQEVAKTYKPAGPKSNDIFYISLQYNNIYCTSKGWHYDSDSNSQGVVQVFNTTNNSWNVFQEPTQTELGHKYIALSKVTIDPRDTSHVFVGAKAGLYEFKDGKFVMHYDSNNSPIKSIKGGTSKNYQMVLGLSYDATGKLWLANSLTDNVLLAYNTNNEWEKYSASSIDTWDKGDNIFNTFLIGPDGNLWLSYAQWFDNSIFCYNPDTKVCTTYKITYNQDGKSIYNDNASYIEDIVFDNDGNLWICGTNGLCYYPKKQLGTTSTTTVTQPKVNRDDGTNLADYLLTNNYTTCLLFDNTNRRYVGTKNNGIFIISADNKEELHHFTTDNSDILSNVIHYMALDKTNGVLYVSTDKGLCSVQTDGIPMPDNADKNNIKVFPNPVNPDYSGPITIEGLPYDCDIKIITSAGAIVHQGRSTLEYYQWDGCDLNGDRVASGVYNVLISTSDGSDGCVAKIAVIK